MGKGERGINNQHACTRPIRHRPFCLSRIQPPNSKLQTLNPTLFCPLTHSPQASRTPQSAIHSQHRRTDQDRSCWLSLSIEGDRRRRGSCGYPGTVPVGPGEVAQTDLGILRAACRGVPIGAWPRIRRMCKNANRQTPSWHTISLLHWCPSCLAAPAASQPTKPRTCNSSLAPKAPAHLSQAVCPSTLHLQPSRLARGPGWERFPRRAFRRGGARHSPGPV